MPIPQPGEKEEEDVFIARCMGNPTIGEEYPDNKQRAAICYSSWKNKDKKEKEVSDKMPESFKRPFTETIYLSDIANATAEAPIDINNLKLPYILKDKILISPGKWNGDFYDANTIIDSYKNTDWTDKQVTSLFLDHDDDSTATWVGEILNPRIVGSNLVGDVAVVDMQTAQKLAYGAKFGISMKGNGNLDEQNLVSDLSYKNFSIVFNPAVKTAFLNRQREDKTKEVMTMGEEKILEAMNKLSEDIKVIGERVQKLEEKPVETPIVAPAATPVEAKPAEATPTAVTPEVKAVPAAVEATPTPANMEAKDMANEEVEKLKAELSAKDAELSKMKESLTLAAKPQRQSIPTPSVDLKKEVMELSQREKAKAYCIYLSDAYHKPIKEIGQARLRGF